MQKAIDQLDVRMTSAGEQTVAIALEICDVAHNRIFIKGAPRSAWNRHLVSILNEQSGIKTVFEDDKIQVAVAPKS